MTIRHEGDGTIAADCLVIVKGDIAQLTVVLASISVDRLDFTKTPMNPYDTYLDVVRSALPGRTEQLRGDKTKPVTEE